MAVDAMRIAVPIRRLLVVSIRTSYTSVCKHPFLVGMLCFLIFLYRSFPYLFSLLVSASPVLICTAVLLGTLLSFGEPNIPEIEKEKEKEGVPQEIYSLKAAGVVMRDATVVVDKDKSLFVGGKKDKEEEATREGSWEKNRVGNIEGDHVLGDYMPLIDEVSPEIQFERQVIEAAGSEFDDFVVKKKREFYEEKQGSKEVLSNAEVVESHYNLVHNRENENLEVDDNKSLRVFIEAEKVDHLGIQHSSWKRANDDGEKEEEEDEEDSDSGSDRAESSSPDASMADIIPMLDELHPLLDEEVPQPGHLAHNGSDAGSGRSHKSKESSVESEDDLEKQEDGEEDGDDDNDNDEEEEEALGGKEDESKSAIKWTDDDQKNLMDLGSLELERNQRLESLIARRRARRNSRLMTEKNLIDFDGAELPINVPPISTTRRNPFDLPYDDVPGSAPSVLLPRHNPFDLPYDSNEEKPDLKGDSFQQEFSAFQHREPLFRRYESFSVGLLGDPKQERQDLHRKPYFVPERFATEGTSYPTFQRQLSEISESKMSSIPDTESVSSAVEDEDKQINEDVSQETDVISNLDHASLLVERGSLSSEDVDSVGVANIERRDVHHDRDEITLGDVENHHELDSSLSTSGGATPVELSTSEILLRMEPGEEEYSSRSSLSSLSDVDEKSSDVKEGSMSLEPRNGQTEESYISAQTSLDSDFHFISEVADENRPRELVLEARDNHTAESGMVVQTSFDSDFRFTNGMEDDDSSMEPVLKSTENQIEDSGILMQDSLNSDSYFTSGIVDSDQQKEPIVEPSGNHISESGILAQTSLSSDFHFTSGVEEDNQHKEPVYDSSPQAVDKSLSFLPISSGTQGERSEMGSPPMSAEFEGKESEEHRQSMEKDASGFKEMHEGSSQKLALDEHESRSCNVKEIEHDLSKVGLSGDYLKLDCRNGDNGFVKPELVVEHDAVDSLPSSSISGSIKVDQAHLEEISNHDLDQLHSMSPNAEKVVVLHQYVIEKSSSALLVNQVACGEIILHALEEQHSSVPVGVSMVSRLYSSESEAVEEHAMGAKGVPQLEQDQVPSSSFDAENHVNDCQAQHEKLDSAGSSCGYVPSNDLNLSASGERQPAVVAEQVFESTNLDTSSSKIKLVEEHSLRKEETLQFKQDKVHSSSSEAVIGAVHFNEADLELVSSESSDQCVPSKPQPHFELERQLTWSDKSVVEPSINDDTELREPSVTQVEAIEEVNIAKDVNVPEVFALETSESISVPPESLGYHSKSDNFDFKEKILDKFVYEDSGHVLEYPSHSVENTDEDEDVIKEIDEGLLSELDTVGDFRVKEVVGESLRDEQIWESSVGTSDYDLLPQNLSVAEIRPELPVLEVRSVTDIDLAFKQLQEGVDVEGVILPSMMESQPTGGESRGPEESNSALQVLEARSLDDINVAMRLESKGNAEEMLKLSDLKGGPAEISQVGSSSSTKELPELEVRTFNDIELVFKQLKEGVDVEEVILTSTIEQHLAVNESIDLRESSLNLQVIEARSLEDLNFSMKQALKENIEEMPKPSDFKGEPVEETNVDSSTSTRELPVLEVRTINGIDLAFKQLNNGVDVEELILPSPIEQHLVVNESKDPQQSSSDMQVLEARSLEDTHILDVNIQGQPESDFSEETVSRASEVDEMLPTKFTNLSTVEATEADIILKSGSSTVESRVQE